MSDVRYNTITWTHRATRGWSYGGGLIDPRTGEIIKATVTLGSLRHRQDYLIFEGVSVDEQGKQHYLDVTVAYRQACLNAIEYLKKFGYSGAQAYSILGTAPVQGHISGVVDVPNACATLWLPTEIFDFDINPTAAGPIKMLDGSVQMPISPDIVK